MPRFNIIERLQLARDICESAQARETLRRAATAVVRGLDDVNFEPAGPLVFKEGALPNGYALCAYRTLVDTEAAATRLLQVVLAMTTHGVFRGRCELSAGLYVGGVLLDTDVGRPQGEELASYCAFATPVELAFGDSDGDTDRLWQVVTKLGYGTVYSWEPVLAAAVAGAFCEQVAP